MGRGEVGSDCNGYGVSSRETKMSEAVTGGGCPTV